MAVERIGKRDGGRPGLAQHPHELPAEIVTIVRNAAVERLGIGRAHGSGGRRALGHVAPPVSLKELLEAAIGEAEEAQAHPVAPELPHGCPRLAQPPLAVGDVHGRARSELPGLVPHRLHVAISRGDQHDAHGAVRRHHPLDQTTRAERLSSGWGGSRAAAPRAPRKRTAPARAGSRRAGPRRGSLPTAAPRLTVGPEPEEMRSANPPGFRCGGYDAVRNSRTTSLGPRCPPSTS